MTAASELQQQLAARPSLLLSRVAAIINVPLSSPACNKFLKTLTVHAALPTIISYSEYGGTAAFAIQYSKTKTNKTVKLFDESKK